MSRSKKEVMAAIGVPTGRGRVTIYVPFEKIPKDVIADAISDQIHKMEWELERAADRLQGLKDLAREF